MWKRLLLLALVAAFAVWKAYGAWVYTYSAEYKIKQFVDEGRESFRLSEVLGNDWSAVCFLPAGYFYNQQPFQAWLSESVERPVYEDEYMHMQRDGSGIALLSSPAFMGASHGGFGARMWGLYEPAKVICTRNPETVVRIQRKEEGFELIHQFERVYDPSNY